jgi:hypothetical protein
MKRTLRKYIAKTVRFFQELPNFFIERRISKLKKTTPAASENGWVGPNQGYLAVCKLAAENDGIFKIFKRSKDYRSVVETVTWRQGKEYAKIIKKGDLLKYLPAFKENDAVGDPPLRRYEIGRFSPTTTRYIKVLMDLKNLFGSLDDFDILEIGVGYGGQCKIISDVYRFKSYTMIDLPAVLPLPKKYLARLGVKDVFFGATQEREYDLIISNYAFAECNRETQQDYIERFLYKSKRGYLIYNYENGAAGPHAPYTKEEILEILSKKHHVRAIEQTPELRKVYEYNFIMVWGEKNAEN